MCSNDKIWHKWILGNALELVSIKDSLNGSLIKTNSNASKSLYKNVFAESLSWKCKHEMHFQVSFCVKSWI